VTVALKPPRRDDPRRSLVPWVVWGLWLLEVAVGIYAFMLFTLPNQALAPAEKAASLVDPIPFLVFATVGAVIVSRRPGNVIGWLCCAIGFGLSLSVFGSDDARTALVADPDRLPAGLIMYGLGSVGFVLSLGLLVTFVLLLFPTGRLPSRRWRLVAWTAGAALAAIAVGTMFQPGSMGPGLPANPVGIKASGEALGLVQGAAAAVVAVLVPACLASLMLRFRRARGAERQQLKWFGFGGAVLVLGGMLALVVERLEVPILGPAFFAAFVSAVPTAIGVAVLRAGLYEIDRLLNRTLVYGLLTALLGAVYAGIVLVLGQVFGGLGAKPPSWAVAGATLAVAALFQPARRHIQQAVDRRFNRRKYNTAKTIEAFATRLRDQVDLDTLSAELLAVVDQTMEPTRVSLWLRPAAHSSSDTPRSEARPTTTWAY
jgi:hypothetical protein